MYQFLQSLESRTLFSAHGVHADPALIATDRQQVLADIQKWRDDKSAGETMLKADRDALTADRAALEELVAPLRNQYNSDMKDFQDRLVIDRAASQSVRDQDLPAILADLDKIKVDHENPDLVSADKDQYKADVLKFRTDMAPFEQQTHDDIALYKSILANDLTAIQDAKKANSAQLSTDCAKLKMDEQSLRALLCADVKMIYADTKKLHLDGGGDKQVKTDTTQKTDTTEKTDKKVEPTSRK
jgi:hypothetical protein